MTNTLNIPPHERVKLLRKGEKVLCKKCKTGIMILQESVNYQLMIRRQDKWLRMIIS